jgi:hypothetical protein
MIMNTTIRKFTYFLTACLLGCFTGHAYEQDNWYLAKEFGNLNTGSYGPAEITVFEGSNSNERKIFVCDQGANKINAYDFNGTLLFTIPSLQKVKGIAVSNEPKIYCLYQSGIKSFHINGSFFSQIATSGNGDGQVTVDSDMFKGRSAGSIKLNPKNGKLYVVDGKNHRIQIFDTNGSFISKFGTQGTAPGQLTNPKDLAIFENGDLLVSDQNALHYFDLNGSFIRKVTSTAEWGFLNSVAIDKGGLIWNSGKLRLKDGTLVSSSLPNGNRAYFCPKGDLYISTPGGTVQIWKRAYRTKGLPQRNVIPQPAIRKISQRSGTNVLDLDFEIIDSDDSNATVGIFAYCDDQMILPKTWVDGTGNKIGTSIATNQTHRVSWDVKQDWNASTGNIKFEILCQDGRTNKPVDLHFLTLPFPDGNMTISRSPLVWADFVNYALFLLSTGEAQYDGNSTSEIVYNGTKILHKSSNGGWVNGPGTRNTLLTALGSNYRFATTAEVTKARAAATPGTENAWDPTNQVIPRNLPYKVNEYGFDVVTKGSNSSNPYSGKYWVIKE